MTPAPEIEVYNPLTGQSIGSIPQQDADDVRAAVDYVRTGQRAWAAMTVHERAVVLQRWADMVWHDQNTLIDIIRRESGKTSTGAYNEIAIVDNHTTYYVQQAGHLLHTAARRSLVPLLQRAQVYYRPYGVVGIISPWNYPFMLAFVDMIPALLAGNAVVLKPSEITPFSAQYGVNKLYEAGVPHNVVQIVSGAGATGAALVEHVDYIAFTGSTAVGRQVAKRAGERLIPCSMELGGKDPLVILRDADVTAAATGAIMGGFENAGQACTSIERVYVERPVYERFVAELQQQMQKLVVGPSADFGVHVGSLTNQRELERVETQVQDAVSKGARILSGGRHRPDLGPLFYEPTVLVDVTHDMLVMQEESFGPVLPVMAVANAEEAIRRANDNVYGLSAGIFSGDVARAEAYARRIDTGDVSINRPLWIWATAAAPMGGQKASGLGRRGGPEGLRRFVNTQSIIIDQAGWVLPQSLKSVTAWTRLLVAVRRALMPYLPFLRP